MDTNNGKFTKNISWEQGDHHLFPETPVMILDHHQNNTNTTNISPLDENLLQNHPHYNDILEEEEGGDDEDLGAMKEMMFKIAAMQPVDIDEATIRKPKRRRNVRISDDPQSVAARQRRERISEKIRILQCLVPGGTKMDTASMLDEAICYVKFLKRQIRLLQAKTPPPSTATFQPHAT